ncbi:HAMP domain-containing sensor histidine kinase [Acidobacterium sp. S8]|uniref:sensor histidine kinase n=1 Tax=Acidobacterium sp. S8 TaxID=1641854 RepID=UPI00131E10FA|nr:HAMP domain-containing sensor histidine kinase [Acidobacterium sp. S8]
MNEFYRVPALVLLGMLLVAFVLLYLQARTIRRLLWLVGWSMVVVHLVTEVVRIHRVGVGFAIANASLVLGALMFLGSMSPLGFKRWPKILYVYAFSAPLLLFTILASLGSPSTPGRIVLGLCTLAAVYSAILWSSRDHLLPKGFTLLFSIGVGVTCLWLTYQNEYLFVMYLAQSSSNFITALLFLAAYRRYSPGIILTAAGFFLWSTPVFLDFLVTGPGLPMLLVGRGTNLIKVMTAFGMILIVLEDELAQNKVAKERDHRARVEMESYSEIDLSLLSGIHMEAAYQRASEVIAEVSRFSEVVLFLINVEGYFGVAAHAGMNNQMVAGLEALGKRMTIEQAKIFGRSENTTVEMGDTVLLDLRPLFMPDDLLENQQYYKAHAMPLVRRNGEIEGVILLSGLKRPGKPLQADDLLPLQLLAARLAAIREHDALLQRVARSERLAGLGQLAAGVAHELNNPLTVVLGYSQLMEEALEGHGAHEMATRLRGSAQRMHQVLESTLRFWKASPTACEAVSIPEILRDLSRLQRPEFTRRQVDLELRLPDGIPPIEGNRSHLQQMFLHLLKNSLEAFDSSIQGRKHSVRVDVSQHADSVKVLISDDGPGFANPEHAFDPFFASKWKRDATGAGLSLCYAIVRDHGGEISAHNIEPHGSVLVVELPFSQKRSGFVQNGWKQ